ncbi:MAG: hypothetical protein QHC65_06340 [Sphingomonas sp.]|nr:hypothetical protein [Sphingomonas sp.]MDX3884021.1 hypothetical protein [Sphingomonas sp.]
MAKFLKIAATVVGVASIAIVTAGAGIALMSGLALSTGIEAASVVSLSTLAAIGAGLGVAASLLGKAPTGVGGAQTSWQSDPNAGIPYVMGRTGTSGNIIYHRAYGGDNKIKSIVTVLSGGGPIDAIEGLYLDDVLQSVNGSGGLTGRLSGLMWHRAQLGATPSTALTSPEGAMAGWTSAHRLSGYAASVLTLKFDGKGDKQLTSEPKARWVVRGVKVYDPRLDSTYPGGSGPCRPLQEATYVYSENPWLHALTWLLGRWQNGKRVIGIGAPIDMIDMAAFVEAASIADANGWKLGGSVTSRPDTRWNALKAMCQAGGGWPISLGAKVSCVINTPRVALTTVTSADLVDDVSVTATQSRRDRINGIVPRYRSEAHGWDIVPGAAIRVPAHVTFDGDERTREVEYSLVQNVNQAAQLARYDIENSREFGPIELPLKLRFWGYKPGDVVRLNVPEAGLVNQDVLLLDRNLSLQNGSVTLTARSETAGKHPFALGQTGTPPPTAAVSGPALVPTPTTAEWAISATTITATGDAAPALVVTGASATEGIDSILFEYRRYTGSQGDGDDWIAAGTVDPATQRITITSVTAATQYQVSIRYRLRDEWGARLILGPSTTGARPGASNTAIVYIYRRSATAPALPTADATYTFATATLTGLNNGWSTTIPAPSGGQPLYVAVASAVNSTATDTIAPGEWTTPEILAQDGTSGAAGINSATVYLYQRNNTGTAPPLPTTNLTYTFATAVLSGALNGWSQTVPADSGGSFLHVTTATAASAAATDNILSTEWAAVRTMAKDGSDGADAINNVNRVRNSQFERDEAGFGISVAGLTATVSPFTIEGGIKQYRASYTATAAGQRLNMYEHPAYAVKVNPGERLAVQCNIRANGPIDRTELQIWYRDAADANFGQETLQTLTGQRDYNTLMQGFALVPAGAVRAFIHVSSYTNAAGTGINAIAQPMISSATAAQTLFPPFTAGPADGANGSPGAPGTDGVTISASPPSIIVQADRDGGVYSGQFPATAQITVLDGNANVTESCTFSSSTGGGATGSVSNAAGTKGLVTATSLPSPNIAGYIMVTVTYGAKTLTLRMNVSKVRDGTNPSAAYPAVPVGLTTTVYPNPIPLDAGQTLTVWAVLDGINPTGGGTMSGSLQYSLDGGSSWNAMGGTASGSATFAVGEPASVHLNGTYTAPSGGATVTVRFIGSKVGAGNITISPRSYMQPK